MKEIGSIGGKARAEREKAKDVMHRMDPMRRKLIAINAARARWGKPKWTHAEEIAWLQGWTAGIEHACDWPRQYRKRAKPLEGSLEGIPNL